MKYKLYKDKAGEFRWNLRADNEKIIADSGEGYKAKQDALDGIELVKDSKAAEIEDLT